MRTMLKSKIHRATVTSVNLDYEGSITIDSDLMEKADILEYEMVHVLDIDNAARFQTYAIRGKPGSGTIAINGAAARLVSKDDLIIILSYAQVPDEEARSMHPSLVYVNSKNEIVKVKGLKSEPCKIDLLVKSGYNS